MALELDTRQRAMLQEMGVRVYLPQAAPSMAVPVHVNEPVTEPAPQRVATEIPVAVVVAPVALTPTLAPMPAPAVSELALPAGGAQALAQAAADCQACGLCAGRKNTTLRAEAIRPCAWMIVCDPPDEDEDREGTSMVQEAGMLLDNMLRAADKDRHAEGARGAYISNVVKCRPPHGHVPEAAELMQCATFLQREIALVQPQLMVAMGRFAHQLLLSEQPEQALLPLGKQRGTVYRYQGIPVVVTYAPSDLLRRSADKAKAWADLCLAISLTTMIN
jgi:uracil-DNA glycosylase